jgi:protein import protein ZIM17
MFGDTTTDIETILKEKGEMVKRGTLGEGGDVEFWDDGSSTPREMIPEERVKNQSLE